MPASSFNLYNMQYARNNFDAMRPAPICPDANHIMGHCQTIHISTNCYHGFHQPKHQEQVTVSNDCEMQELPMKQKNTNSRKRCADETDYPQLLKRHREEVQTEKRIIKPETGDKKEVHSEENILESLYWNIHGGSLFHLLQQCL